MKRESEKVTNLRELIQSYDTKIIGKNSVIIDRFHSFLVNVNECRPPDFFQTLWWSAILVFASLTSIFSSINITLFIVATPKFSHDINHFLFYRVTIEEVAVRIVVAVIAVLVLEFACLFIFLNKHNLPRFIYIILYICFQYLPPVAGIILGADCGLLHGVSEVRDFYSIFDNQFILIEMILLVLLVFNTQVYTNICDYCLALGKSEFAYYVCPFNGLDVLICFSIGLSMIHRFLDANIYFIFFTAMQIILGVYRLFTSKSIIYAGPIGSYLYAFYNVAVIAAAIQRIIRAYFNEPLFILIFSATVIILIASIIILYKTFLRTEIKDGGLGSKKGEYDISKTKNPNASLAILRTVPLLSKSKVFTANYFNVLMQNKFSDKLVVDITRLCLVMNIPLESIKVPYFFHRPKNVFGMKFLAYQLRLHDHYNGDFTVYKPNKLPFVDNSMKEMLMLVEKTKNKIRNFWTEADLEKPSVHVFADQIHQYTTRIQEIASEFAGSKEVNEVWRNFCTNVVYLTSMVPSAKIDLMDELNNPHGSVLESQVEKYDKKEKPIVMQSKLEQYFLELPNRKTEPIIWIARLFFICMYFSYHSINDSYNNKMKDSWFLFHNMTMVGQISEICGRIAHIKVEKSTTLPNIDVIASILGISLDEAKVLRSKEVISVSESEYNSTFEFLKTAPSHTNDSIENCPHFTGTLLFRQAYNHDTWTSSEYCATSSLQILKNSIDNFAQIISDNLELKVDIMKDTNIIIIAVCISIFTVLFFITIINEYMLRKRMIFVLNRITRMKDRCEATHKNDIQSSYIISVILWFIAIGLIINEVTRFEGYCTSYRNKIKDLSNQIRMVSKIATSAHFLLALKYADNLSEVQKNVVRSFIQEEVQYAFEAIEELSNNIDPAFSELFCLGNFNTNTSDSCSMGLFSLFSLLAQGNETTIENYELQKARKYYFELIQPIIQSTIPAMAIKARQSCTTDSRTYFTVTYHSIIVFGLIWIFFEYQNRHIKFWIKGFCHLCRHAIVKYPNQAVTIKNLIEGENNDIEEIPYPIIVSTKGIKTSDGSSTVIEANSSMIDMLKTSKDQLLMQPCPVFSFVDETTIKRDCEIEVEEEIRVPKEQSNPFNAEVETVTKPKIETKTFLFNVEEYENSKGEIFTILRECTNYHNFINEYNKLYKRYVIGKPFNKLPCKGDIYYFKVLFGAQFQPEELCKVNELEKNYPIVRTNLSASCYNAIMIKENNEEEIATIVDLIKHSFEEFKDKKVTFAVAGGNAAVYSLCENNCVPFVTGECVDLVNRQLMNYPDTIFASEPIYTALLAVANEDSMKGTKIVKI